LLLLISYLKSNLANLFPYIIKEKSLDLAEIYLNTSNYSNGKSLSSGSTKTTKLSIPLKDGYIGLS
jgi:hypothetical protein